MASIIECKGVSKVYSPKSAEVIALYNINLSINDGEIYLVHGKSGSGKSTLLNIMAGLDTPTKGNVVYKDKGYSQMSESEQARIRGTDFGFIYQSFNLFENLSVYDNIALPLKINGHKIDRDMISNLASEMGINKLMKKKVYQLSGGEQQRVAIARAMVMRPCVLFADEPTGNLDSENTAIVSELLYKINRIHNTTLVIVSHDMAFMRDNCHLVVLRDGIIENEK